MRYLCLSALISLIVKLNYKPEELDSDEENKPPEKFSGFRGDAG
jgi:hypothetical protein